MDASLQSKLNQLIKKDNNTTGVLLTDKQGLCLKAMGNADAESSGLVAAVVDLAGALEPTKTAPTIIFESDSKCCMMFSKKHLNAAVFMQESA